MAAPTAPDMRIQGVPSRLSSSPVALHDASTVAVTSVFTRSECRRPRVSMANGVWASISTGMASTN